MRTQPRSLRTRAARAAWAWLVPVVSIAVLLVAGTLAGQAGFVNAGTKPFRANVVHTNPQQFTGLVPSGG